RSRLRIAVRIASAHQANTHGFVGNESGAITNGIAWLHGANGADAATERHDWLQASQHTVIRRNAVQHDPRSRPVPTRLWPIEQPSGVAQAAFAGQASRFHIEPLDLLRGHRDRKSVV